MLSKLATQSLGRPSASALRSSSDTRPRCVRVSATTTTEPIRSATGSLVSTRTGRSPPGVAANQTSPRCIGPVGPVLSQTPVADRGQRLFPVVKRLFLPPLGVVLAREPEKLTAKRVPQQLRPVDTEPCSPCLNLLRVSVIDPKAQHRHTHMLLPYDTFSRAADEPSPRSAATSVSGGADEFDASVVSLDVMPLSKLGSMG
jgi:hypothetical protein